MSMTCWHLCVGWGYTIRYCVFNLQ